MFRKSLSLSIYLVLNSLICLPSVHSQFESIPPKPGTAVRVATYNVSLNRKTAGALAEDLRANDPQASSLAAVIRAVRPDVLLLNEIDFDEQFDNAEQFERNYLSAPNKDAFGNAPWPMPYRFSAPVNTGVPSGLDVNQDGQLGQPVDAWGYGVFPGQYGMAILSRFEIDDSSVETLQKMLWSQLPEPRQPMRSDGTPYYAPECWSRLRISSKSFWDVPVNTPLGRLHVLASHPTPPAFDGPEDHNGCRNHDEIKLIQHYIERCEKLVNDLGQPTGLPIDARFVILGDLNSDPVDGESQRAAIKELLQHPLVGQYAAPKSKGAVEASVDQAGMNQQHQSDAATDTADFNDRSVGNLRVDYALPSKHFRVSASGVFWPGQQGLEASYSGSLQASLKASDHHLVWIDIEIP